ncbi:MAG: hypothetical protein ACREI9_04600 [Nitrospiraceae bacterium]
MAARRRKRRARNYSAAPRRRRTARRRTRRNPYTLNFGARRPRRRRARARRNPLVPTGLLQKGLAVAAGFLAAPRIASLIPFELPGGKIGQYVKEFLVVSVGSQVVKKALGAKYGNALFAGGVIHIGVDMLQTYVPTFGGGMGYYFPPNDQLALEAGGMGTVPALPEMFQTGSVERLSSRFN